MNDNTEHTENRANPESTAGTPPEGVFRLMDVEQRCPDCDVTIGEAHEYDEYDGGCDVARCLVTGLQRLMCDLDHDCGQDVWTGWWPGHLDCERLGWMLGPGFPDLNRLYTKANWDPEQRAWVPSPDAHRTLASDDSPEVYRA